MLLSGSQVRRLLDNYANDDPADVYTVSRVLPAIANVWRYRLKQDGDGQERAVSEQQQRSMAEMQQDAERIRNARASERARVVARRSERKRH